MKRYLIRFYIVGFEFRRVVRAEDAVDARLQAESIQRTLVAHGVSLAQAVIGAISPAGDNNPPPRLSDDRIAVLASRAGSHPVGAPATREEECAMAVEIENRRFCEGGI